MKTMSNIYTNMKLRPNPIPFCGILASFALSDSAMQASAEIVVPIPSGVMTSTPTSGDGRHQYKFNTNT